MGPRGTLGISVALLAVHNVVGNLWLPQWSYVPVNLIVGGVLVAAAYRAGIDPEEIAGPRSWLRRGFLVGATAGVGVAALLGIAAVVPAAGDAFADDRVLGVSGAGLAYHALVRIPLGTALFEEVAFRGVLPALGRHVTTPALANLGAAGLFGLWHVIPSSSVASGNAAASSTSVGLVVVSAVAATGIAGLGFSWLRDRHGLAAPAALHAVVNAAAFGTAWLMA